MDDFERLQKSHNNLVNIVAGLLDILRREIHYDERERAKIKFQEIDRLFDRYFLSD